MYYPRKAEQLVKRYLKAFPIVAVMGPRQSGKSTMLAHLFSGEYKYVNFDNFETLSLFNNDPRKFIEQYNKYVIFDEAQHVPGLFPLLKEVVDQERQMYGRFILTGSGQFLMGKHISESLAGRVAIIQLMPLQASEVPDRFQPSLVYRGSYPELIVNNYAESQAWYSSYIQTYIQKDLRQFINITDIHTFTLFIKFLASNAAQVMNLSSISREIGVTVSTLARWLSVLEESYILFLLQPFYRNIGKRLIKSPKLYFMDTGLLAYLTGISTFDQWEQGTMYGAIFENFVVAEMIKRKFHEGLNYDLYFLRTNHGDEVDLIIDTGTKLELAEIKASVTYRPVFHKTMEKLNPASSELSVIYQGQTTGIIPNVKAWNFLDYLQKDLNI